MVNKFLLPFLYWFY